MSKKQGRDTSGFGKHLRVLRKKRKITMKNLAKQLGVSESYISRLESSERHPDKELILKMEPILFPEGNPSELDKLLISADYTPVNLDQKTGQDDVVLHFQQLIEKDPDNFRAYNALIILLIKQGNLKAAQQRIETGMTSFKNSVQLKVLDAALQLAQKDLDAAIALQQEALAAYATLDAQAKKQMTLGESDLLYNLGDMYFVQGYGLVDVYLQKKTKSAYTSAHRALEQAADTLARARDEDPDNVLILDEHAKVLFNQAYLEESAGHPSSYTQAIDALQQVIHSEHKLLLNYTNLMESTLSLIHAYAKIREFATAEQHIHMVECCLPNYWMVHYIKACVYSLKYLQTEDSEDYGRGISSLQRAVSAPEKHNRTAQEAPYDPDLMPLQKVNPTAFQDVLQSRAPEALS